MGIMSEEIGRYDPYTDKFIKNTTADRIKVGTDGSLYNLSVSSSYGLYAKNQEELDKCDYIDRSTKLYTEDEVVAMFTELQDELKHTNLSGLWKPNYLEGFNDSVATSVKKIQCRIDKLKGNENGNE